MDYQFEFPFLMVNLYTMRLFKAKVDIFFIFIGYLVMNELIGTRSSAMRY